ncbi:MAG TPA: helix-turn-helix domain-containing protein [Thermodesulfovibrionales bacterium]|nr:helix-turn-helix domain-containing protein [Thermodesulfovibrionales bacterium]
MKFLSVKEVSEMLGVKEKTIYQWAELRRMPSIMLNGTLRFNNDHIMEWVDACTREANSGYNPFIKLEARKGGKTK